MRNVGESLAGRVAVLTLYPFSLSEMMKDIKPKLDQASDFINRLMKTAMVQKKLVSLGQWFLEGGCPEIFVNKKVVKKYGFLVICRLILIGMFGEILRLPI